MATFDEKTIALVWNKGQIIPGTDPSVRRKDICGAWIYRDKHGDRSSDFNEGWEIDHIIPESQNGSDQLINLRPLHWKNNARKSDGSLVCAVSAK